MLVTHDGGDITMKNEELDGSDRNEYQCLIRATNGKNINFSTRVRFSSIVLISNADTLTRLITMN